MSAHSVDPEREPGDDGFDPSGGSAKSRPDARGPTPEQFAEFVTAFDYEYREGDWISDDARQDGDRNGPRVDEKSAGEQYRQQHGQQPCGGWTHEHLRCREQDPKRPERDR